MHWLLENTWYEDIELETFRSNFLAILWISPHSWNQKLKKFLHLMEALDWWKLCIDYDVDNQ